MAWIDAKDGVGGVLFDHGTGKRIPFARRFDPLTGEWEGYWPAPNGVDVLGDDCGQPIVRRGKAKGKLELIPMGKAAALGQAPVKPQVQQRAVRPMTKDEQLDGLETYKKAYQEVWHGFRGEAKRCVQDRWQEFLAKSDMFDSFILAKTVVPVATNDKR